jgi:sensor histidine kinase YesM
MNFQFNYISKYWLFQLLGWGTFIAINTFFAVTFSQIDRVYIGRLIIFVGIGLIMSHLMRTLVKRNSLLSKSLAYQIIGFILISLVFALIIGIIEAKVINWAGLEYKEELKLGLTQLVIANSFYSFIYLFIWNCIYFIYHYINETRQQQVDTLKLETLVKSLELKTIKSHINPHFIFNALNSIRALIDENPARARTAVTGLSNILRSSMLTDQQETISLEKELNIVQDYLALEQIRFEDRLSVIYEIDDDTLDNLVPPMMLQMLVENAIKHGISKLVEGGIVKIISQEEDGYFNLIVQNTGHFESRINNDGFGIQSTESRLRLIFGSSASFSIFEKPGAIVEAKVIIPTQK